MKVLLFLFSANSFAEKQLKEWSALLYDYCPTLSSKDQKLNNPLSNFSKTSSKLSDLTNCQGKMDSSNMEYMETSVLHFV